ncbi:hypothetical protein HPB51_028716 [Rhipicephalus microplus]|uniref:Uncharacterized protein n=1 Tax=Rhipicephalus microplus TaxID=6941 RepID=A0A9J6CW65_RHIMP|nr:hypothetical protein HPB51_028716 [Rhipicephalus microplus]
MSSADISSCSTGDDTLSNAERERWILATVIAFSIITTITVLAFVLQRLLTTVATERPAALAEHNEATELLLNAVRCNSSLCRRYSSLIASCVGNGRVNPPCVGFSRYVCGPLFCHGREVASLVRSYLRSLAADALNVWRHQGGDQWTAVDRAASLYAACRRVQSTTTQIIQQDDDIYDDENMAQTATVLYPNERVGQLAARLAARYQDGGIFWIDAVPLRGGQSKRRLLLDINKQFLRFAEQSDSIPWRHRRRTMMDGASSPTEEPIEGLVEEVSRGIREVLAKWKEAGNLLVHNPFSVSLRSLDEYGLDSNVLVHGLNAESSDVGDRYSGDDEIEVINQVLLPFLRKVLLHSNINMAPYLAWEFARHKRECFAPYRARNSDSVQEDSCFECIERVAGLAAHAPFLRASADVQSRAKVTLFVDRHIKGALLSHILDAQWLSNKQQELMVQRLYWSRVVRGVPACEDGLAKLNSYYADLPPTTGHFWNDISAAARAAWQRILRRPALSAMPFPLLSVEPNVLLSTTRCTSRPSTWCRRSSTMAMRIQESTASWFCTRASPGASAGPDGSRQATRTGSLRDVEPHDDPNPLPPLNRGSERYPNQLADLMASGPVLKAFESVTRGDSETRKMFVGACLLTCSGNDPLRCDLAASQTTNFAKSFYCLNMSAMAPATRYTVW